MRQMKTKYNQKISVIKGILKKNVPSFNVCDIIKY